VLAIKRYATHVTCFAAESARKSLKIAGILPRNVVTPTVVDVIHYTRAVWT